MMLVSNVECGCCSCVLPQKFLGCLEQALMHHDPFPELGNHGCLHVTVQVAWRCWSGAKFAASQGWNAMLGLLSPVLFDP
jgi:hypothetical protein